MDKEIREQTTTDSDSPGLYFSSLAIAVSISRLSLMLSFLTAEGSV